MPSPNSTGGYPDVQVDHLTRPDGPGVCRRDLALPPEPRPPDQEPIPDMPPLAVSWVAVRSVRSGACSRARVSRSRSYVRTCCVNCSNCWNTGVSPGSKKAPANALCPQGRAGRPPMQPPPCRPEMDVGLAVMSWAVIRSRSPAHRTLPSGGASAPISAEQREQLGAQALDRHGTVGGRSWAR